MNSSAQASRFLIVVLAGILSLCGLCNDASAQTRTLNAKCTLKIDGAVLLDDRCHFSSTADSDNFDDLRMLIVCPNGRDAAQADCAGYEQRVARQGVFGYLFRESGVGRLCWNEGSMRKAQSCFEGLRRTGACWSNPRATASGDASRSRSVELCAWRS
jgi:hypothetical protein